MLIKKSPAYINKLHFLSDGPVTQHKGRGGNLHLLANIPFAMGFSQVRWNLSEAGHGKGAADGVGAAIKRLADRLVTGLFLSLPGMTNVELFYIPANATVPLPNAIPSVKVIMKVHQVYSNEPGKISVRVISSCCSSANCACYTPVEHDVLRADTLPITQTFQGRPRTQQPTCQRPITPEVVSLQSKRTDSLDVAQNVQGVEQPPPSVEEPPLLVEKPPPLLEKPPPSVEEPPSSVEQPPPSVEQPPKSVEQLPTSVEKPPQSGEEPPPSVQQPPKSVEQPHKSVEQPSTLSSRLRHLSWHHARAGT